MTEYLLQDTLTEFCWSKQILMIHRVEKKTSIKRSQMPSNNQYSPVDQAHLWAHPCQCLLEAPSVQEGPVAPGARVALLAPDLPVWRNNTLKNHYGVLFLDCWDWSHYSEMIIKRESWNVLVGGDGLPPFITWRMSFLELAYNLS